MFNIDDSKFFLFDYQAVLMENYFSGWFEANIIKYNLMLIYDFYAVLVFRQNHLISPTKESYYSG